MSLKFSSSSFARNLAHGIFGAFLALFGTPFCASLGAVFVVVTGSDALSAEPPPLSLSWIEEDGTDLPLEWRTSSAWVWQAGQFALRVWIEAPSDFVDGRAGLVRESDTLRIQSSGTAAPFKLKPDHVFLVALMREPIRLIELRPSAMDSRMRALRVEALPSKTTWMQHSTCGSIGAHLIERERRAPTTGPFFIALRCPSTLAKRDGSGPALREFNGEHMEVVQIQISEESTASIRPVKPSILRQPTTIQFSLSAPSPKSNPLIATIEARTHNGAPLAEFEVRYDAQKASLRTTQNFPNKPKSHSGGIGLSMAALNAVYNSPEEIALSGTSPAIVASWRWRGEGVGLISDLRLPLSVLDVEPRQNQARWAWARILTVLETKRSPQPDPFKRVWGAKLSSLSARNVDTGSPIWLSPTFGFQIDDTSRGIDWTVLLTPFALGAGFDGWARLELSAKGEVTLAKSKSAALKAFAEVLVLKSFSHGDDGWASNGVDIGLRGEFE